MKNKNLISLFALLALLVMMGACNDDAYNDLPDSVAKFVSEYYPFSEVSSCTMSNGNYVVNMRNGATLVFDNALAWIDVNGNGGVVPETFLYNCLPDDLYGYIQNMELLNGVHRVSRSSDYITVYTVDTYFRYDISTGLISYPTARGIAANYFSEWEN